MPRLLPVLRFCLLLLPAASAAPTAVPIPLQALPTLAVGKYEPSADRWLHLLHEAATETFGIYSVQSGAKLGWLSLSRQIVKSNGTPLLQIRETTHYNYLLEGEHVDYQVLTEYDFELKSPCSLARASHEEIRGKSQRLVLLTRSARAEYDAEIHEGGTTIHRQLSNLEFTALDFLGARLWAIESSRQRGDCQSFRGLDVKSLEPFVQKVCLKQRLDGNVAQAEVTDTKHQFGSMLNLSAGGGLTGMVIAGRSELRPETLAQAKASSEPTDLLEESLVPCNRPLGNDLRKFGALHLVLRGAELNDLPNTLFQRASSSPASGAIFITTGEGPAVPASPEEIKENLASTPLLPLEQPALKALLKRALGNATTPEAKVKRLIEFVSHFIKNDIKPPPLGLMEILQRPRGDCTTHALLFTALARAAGIPCREATGYIYLGDQKQAFGGHAWNEVVLDGHWHPVDPTWEEFTPNAAHIQLGSGTPGLRDARFFNGGVSVEAEP